MRTRQRFQPILDVLSARVSPSTIGFVQPGMTVALAAPVLHSNPPMAHSDDSDMPETGVLRLLVLPVIPTTPPPTLTC
jgi:hypothetical protein